jgi:hypothetical protein
MTEITAEGAPAISENEPTPAGVVPPDEYSDASITAAYARDLYTYISSSLDIAEYLNQIGHGSRELTNAITRMEEAEFWVLKSSLPTLAAADKVTAEELINQPMHDEPETPDPEEEPAA